MPSQNSDSRRRRLLQSGLIGEASTKPTTSAVTDRGNGDSAEEVISETLTDAVCERASQAVFQVSPQQQTNVEGQCNNESSQGSNGPRPACDAGLATIRSLLTGTQPLTWVFTGDNIVQAAFYTEGQRGFAEIFSERLRAELRRSMDIVVNTGMSGDTISHALTTVNWRVLRFRPDVVVLSVGLNDAKEGCDGLSKFQRSVREYLDQVRMRGAIPVIVLPHPVASSALETRQSLPEYVDVLRKTAARDEVPVVDQWGFWQKHWSSPSATRKRLRDGRLHLNADSHRQLAALLFATLGIYDPQSSSCQCAVSPSV